MKRCPQCNRVEADEALSFCGIDGTSLVEDSRGEAETIRLDSASLENATSTLLIRQYYLDFEGVEREYQQAIKPNPRYLPAHEWRA